MNMLKEYPIFWINWNNLLVTFILAVSLYPFAGKGIQGVKATDQNTPHLSGVFIFTPRASYSPKPKIGSFFFF